MRRPHCFFECTGMMTWQRPIKTPRRSARPVLNILSFSSFAGFERPVRAVAQIARSTHLPRKTGTCSRHTAVRAKHPTFGRRALERHVRGHLYCRHCAQTPPVAAAAAVALPSTNQRWRLPHPD